MAFFGLLKKKQKFEEATPIIEKKSTNMIDSSKPDPIAQMLNSIPDSATPSSMKTYDIIVYESQADGTKKQTAVNGVKAHSPKELIALYAADGTQIRILKEYSSADNPPQSSPMSVQANAPMQTVSNNLTDKLTVIEPKQASYESIKKPKEPPKFFEIGGVKCKLEDGKMFQEQWIRVDSTKYRLIADATNKIASMNGKHLEMLKWVQIEDEQGDIKNA